MKRLLAVLSLGLLALLGAPLTAFADVPSRALTGFAAADDDYAKEFHVDYVLAEDGSVEVTEHITWQFPAGQERHGIFRNIKVRAGYQDRQDEYRYYEMSQVSVTSPTGAPTDISISDNGAFKQIRVGSPSETVSGVQKYVVRYTLAHYVNDIGDGTAEFYFNTIDSSNYDRYDNVSASLQAPAAATKVACYYGPRGSTDTCDATAGGVSQFEAPDAQPGVGVSVIASYPRDAFGTLTVDLRKGSAGSQSESSLSPAAQDLVRTIGIAVGAFLPFAALAGMGALVWQRGRDETYAGLTPGLSPGPGQSAETVPTTRAPMAAVQFTPPEGVQPGMVGTVIDETANVVDVTATLIDLAVRGHLTIAKIDKEGFFGKDDWELTRTTPRVERQPLADYEQLLLSKVFATDNVIRLSSLKNTFASTLKSVQDHMYAEVVRRGWFARSPQSQRSGWVALGTVLMVLGPVLFFFGGGVTGILGTGVGGATGALAIGLFLSGLIVRVLGRRMAARTAEGTAVLVQSRGFEEYLKTAEADQIKWEEAEQIFSRFLPYAIVFGLADRWAQVFAEVAAAAAAAGHAMTQPVWYIGPWDPTFGYGGLAHSMDDFSTTAAGTFVSTPGSSGGSGFSSGGGFSGGGGGGSSGGSW